MTTKLDELKALLADREKIGEYVAVSLDQPDLRALIAAVEAAQEVYKEWDEDKEPDESCHLYPPHYKQLGAALAPFGENDEQKDTGRA